MAEQKTQVVGVWMLLMRGGNGLSQRETMMAPSGQANVVLLREVGPITFLNPKSIEITPKTFENPLQLIYSIYLQPAFFSRFSSVLNRHRFHILGLCTRPFP